jgi:Lectin C-type domain
MRRPRHDRPEEASYRLVQTCALMLCIACSTTLDPTTAGSAPALGAGGSGGAASGAGGEPEATGGSATPMIVARSLSDCVTSTLGDHQYFACAEIRTFAEASADCVQAGTILIKVDTSAETTFLKGLSFPGQTWGWLGAARDAAFDWSWADGTPFWHGAANGMAEPGAYTNWHDAEPDNTSQTVRQDEACGTFDLGDATWFDRYCELLLPYVCELTPAGSAAGDK